MSHIQKISITKKFYAIQYIYVYYTWCVAYHHHQTQKIKNEPHQMRTSGAHLGERVFPCLVACSTHSFDFGRRWLIFRVGYPSSPNGHSIALGYANPLWRKQKQTSTQMCDKLLSLGCEAVAECACECGCVRTMRIRIFRISSLFHTIAVQMKQLADAYSEHDPNCMRSTASKSNANVSRSLSLWLFFREKFPKMPHQT